MPREITPDHRFATTCPGCGKLISKQGSQHFSFLHSELKPTSVKAWRHYGVVGKTGFYCVECVSRFGNGVLQKEMRPLDDVLLDLIRASKDLMTFTELNSNCSAESTDIEDAINRLKERRSIIEVSVRRVRGRPPEPAYTTRYQRYCKKTGWRKKMKK